MTREVLKISLLAPPVSPTMTEFTEPGIYANVPELDYHADCYPVSLSNSVLKVEMAQSLAHARLLHPRINPDHKPKHSAAFDLGTSFHVLALQDEPKIEICDFSDWRKNEAKAVKAAAYALGRVPLLTHEYATVLDMCGEFNVQLGRLPQCEGWFVDGDTELTLCWDEPVLGTDHTIRARCRIDWTDGAGTFVDLKSTGLSAAPRDFSRAFFRLGYDIQAAWYSRGISRLYGADNPAFFFAVCETTAPFAVGAYGVSNAALGLANEKIDRALVRWDKALRSDEWPAYSSEIQYLGPTDWMIAQWEDEKTQEEADARAV